MNEQILNFTKEKVIPLLTWAGVALAIAIGLKQEIGNRKAGTKGICVKAHISSSVYRSSVFLIDVDYAFNKKHYTGVISSNERIKVDSCYIKIDPYNPEYLAYSPKCNERL